MKQDKLLGLLGMARRANRLAAGVEDIVSAAAKGKCRAVLIASDISENSLKKLTNSCEYYKVEIHGISYTKEELGSALGLAAVGAVGINDAGFYKAYKKMIHTSAVQDK